MRRVEETPGVFEDGFVGEYGGEPGFRVCRVDGGNPWGLLVVGPPHGDAATTEGVGWAAAWGCGYYRGCGLDRRMGMRLLQRVWVGPPHGDAGHRNGLAMG